MKNVVIIIYTDDPICLNNREKLFSNIHKTFGISVKIHRSCALHFVPLRTQKLLLSKTYPILTLAGQALGSIIVGLEAVIRCPPDVFIDTTGFAFTLPVAKWFARASTAAYVHYPTISSDMVRRIASSINAKMDRDFITSYNNASWIRNNKLITYVKLLYYQLLTLAYKFVGSRFNVCLVMVNSSWTRNHISALWGGSPSVLYPPCRVVDVQFDQNKQMKRQPWILSVGQFRPEKNHELQLEAFHLFLKRQNLDSRSHDFKLILVGGCRDQADELLVQKYKKRCDQLRLNAAVKFCVNAPYADLENYLTQSSINLHTMIDEHFGIGIVEGMGSGLITVAHNSGGPQADIIGPEQCDLATLASSNSEELVSPGVGFLASNASEYASVFDYVLNKMPAYQFEAIQCAARNRAKHLFSDEHFSDGWLKQISVLGLDDCFTET